MLLTAVRWPPSRFTSALEQFSIPQRTGVPCKRTRRESGGRCHGRTCERDFDFSWRRSAARGRGGAMAGCSEGQHAVGDRRCLNESAPRYGMLATTTRCLLGTSIDNQATLLDRTRAQLSDLDAISAAGPPTGAEALHEHVLGCSERDRAAVGPPPDAEAAAALQAARRTLQARLEETPRGRRRWRHSGGAAGMWQASARSRAQRCTHARQIRSGRCRGGR